VVRCDPRYQLNSFAADVPEESKVSHFTAGWRETRNAPAVEEQVETRRFNPMSKV
jgi:hypothetical protein